MHKSIAIFVLIFIACTSVMAQETFQPDYCDFEVTLPGSYHLKPICRDDGQECTNKARYTQMEETSALSIDLICAPLPPEIYDIYDKNILAAFTQRILQDYEIDDSTAEFSFDENSDKGLKSSTTVAYGTQGRSDLLLIIQFWLTQNSMLTSEIHMVGRVSEDLQKTAANVMQSVTINEKAN